MQGAGFRVRDSGSGFSVWGSEPPSGGREGGRDVRRAEVVKMPARSPPRSPHLHPAPYTSHRHSTPHTPHPALHSPCIIHSLTQPSQLCPQTLLAAGALPTEVEHHAPYTLDPETQIKDSSSGFSIWGLEPPLSAGRWRAPGRAHQPWTLNPEPCTLHPAPCTLNPKP